MAYNAITHFSYEWPDNCRILDAGCAVGNVTKHLLATLSPKITEVVGFDKSHDMVEFANINNSGPCISYYVADLQDGSSIPKAWAGYFDKIFSSCVLHFLPDQALALKILHSCLKPNGEAVLFLADSWPGLNRAFNYFQQSEKWRPYLKDFRTPLIMIDNIGSRERNKWTIAEDPLLEYKKIMQENGFQDVTVDRFPPYKETRDGEGTVEYLLGFLPQLNLIPKDKHREFAVEFREILYSFDDPACRNEAGNYVLLSDAKTFVARGYRK